MEPAFRKFLGYALGLSIAGTAFAGDDSKKSEDALDTARRDLQSLPTVEGNILPGDRLPDASLPVPTFAPLTTNPGKSNAEENRTSPASGGWLIDALRKTDELNTQRNGGVSNKAWTGDAIRPRGPDTPASNPLRTYLDLWLSPQDKQLLAARKSASGESALDKNDLRAAAPFQPKLEFDLVPALNKAKQRSFGMNTPGFNPYLASQETDPPLLTEPLTTLPNADQQTTVAPTTLPSGGNLYPTPHDTLPSLQNRKAEGPLPAPTAPLIDERRYFPQLRRF